MLDSPLRTFGGLLPLLLQLARRGLTLWLLTRALVAVALALANAPPVPIGASATTIMLLVLLGVGIADLARRRERAWFENLGIGLGGALFLQLAWGCLAEILFTVAATTR